MRKILTAILALIISATALISLASCKNENAPSTGWDVKALETQGGEDESGNPITEDTVQKLGFYVGDGTKKISEVWVNISKIYDGTADFTLDVYTGELNKKTSSPTYPSFERKVTKDEVKKSKDVCNWIKLGFDNKWNDIAANKQIMLTVNGNFDFNEIVFIGTDGNKLSVSLEKLDVWYFKKVNGGDIAMNAKSKSDLIDLEKSPIFLIDEQSKFDLRDKK